MGFKKPESGLAFGQVLGTPHQSAQAFSGSPAAPVMKKPVLFLHIRKHSRKAFRHMLLLKVQDFINTQGKLLKGVIGEF